MRSEVFSLQRLYYSGRGKYARNRSSQRREYIYPNSDHPFEHVHECHCLANRPQDQRRAFLDAQRDETFAQCIIGASDNFHTCRIPQPDKIIDAVDHGLCQAGFMGFDGMGRCFEAVSAVGFFTDFTTQPIKVAHHTLMVAKRPSRVPNPSLLRAHNQLLVGAALKRSDFKPRHSHAGNIL